MTHLLAQSLSHTAVSPSPIGPTIVDLFTEQVASRPLSIALEAHGETFTYAALGARIDALAQWLTANGIGRGDVVALCLRRTENLVIGMFGVLAAGAAYLPLNRSDPSLRLSQVIQHAKSRFVVTDSQSMANIPPGLADICVLDQQPPTAPESNFHGVPAGSTASDLAYVMYTSGTTGVPKGVEVTHGALANVFADIAERVHFTESDIWLAVTTVSFDIAALELLLPLCYGGKIILASEDQARIGRILMALMQHKKPTIMQATPITFRILMESGWAGSPDLTILCGGDRLDRDLANKLIVRSAGLWNMYGPTETTIWSSAELLSLSDETVTIGRPMANTEIYILDGDGHLQDGDHIGEICIGGVGLARGYVNDPELTRRCFVDLQVSRERTTRVYRTGDLGRWNAKGNLEFHGRIDHQVKINGYRIELAEVETAIRKFPGVADVAVLGVGGETNQKRLYGFIVAEPSVEVTAVEVVGHLGRHLPKYMIPERLFSIDRLPISPNGKRDLKALEALARVQAELPR